MESWQYKCKVHQTRRKTAHFVPRRMQHGVQNEFSPENGAESSLGGVQFSRREWLKEISIPVYVLVILFAVASWVDINGLWVELPLLVSELPEGWSLPSYLSIIIQIANVGPIIYTIANRAAPNKVKEWPVIYVIISIGALACLLLTFLWSHTSFVLGQERSTALISLSSFLALVDTTSSVVFLPYMALFKAHYMSAFYIGEGLSGLIPGLVGLVQGIGTDPVCKNVTIVIHNSTTGQNTTEHKVEAVYPPPVFSVEVFFFFLFGLLVISCLAFSCLNFSAFARQEMVTIQDDKSSSSSGSVTFERALDEDEQINFLPGRSNKQRVNLDDIGKILNRPALTYYQMGFLLAASVWLNALANGFIAATQSYSSLPYSNMAYNLSVRLSTVANPLACLLALFLPSKSKLGTGVLTLLGSGCAAYQIYLAAMSPEPPLAGTAAGEFLVILTSVLMTAFFSYAKVSIATILRDEGRKALLWCGISQQVGSFMGAVIAFLLVNVFQVFTSVPPCPGMY